MEDVTYGWNTTRQQTEVPAQQGQLVPKTLSIVDGMHNFMI
jgi:hypothetical protein